MRGAVLLVVLGCACTTAAPLPAAYPQAMYAGAWTLALDALAETARAAAARGDRTTEIRALVATSRVRLDEGLNRRADVSLALAPAERALRLAEQGGGEALRADALDRIGMVRYWEWALADEDAGDGPLLAAEAAFERARALRRDGGGLAYSHFHLGLIADGKGQAVQARDHFQAALAGAGVDRALESYALRHVAAHDRDAAQAEARLRRSLALRHELGWKAGTASAMDALAKHLVTRGRTEEARTLLREALQLARAGNSPYYATRVAQTLASLEEQQGNPAAALAVLDDTSREIAMLAAAPLRAEYALRLQRLRCPACTAP